jgi:NAD(P)-dependent dehydrogenase (short-subunit alcohol dehydrogenase family)
MNPAHILILGASRGIGLEFVRQYRADGAEVTASARSADGVARIEALGARAFMLDVAAADTALPPLPGEGFDLIIYNAGVFGPRTQGCEPPTRADFDAVMQANVYGAMRLLPQAAARLRAGGRLAILSSRMGSIGLRGSTAGWLYRASKAAANSVLKDLSIEQAGRAICVALHPGWVRTDMGGQAADIDVATSVAGMRALLARLTPSDNGGFFDYGGNALTW